MARTFQDWEDLQVRKIEGAKSPGREKLKEPVARLEKEWPTTMTCQVFVGEKISSNYQKYRFTAPDEVIDSFLQFLDEKVGS